MTDIETFRQRARKNLRAAYNFVTVEPDYVLSPAEALNRSRPFPDGLSGELSVRWTAETQLLVGGSENNRPFTLRGETDYALPGASLRGMIRSVLEIAAFARLSFVNGDQYFGIRDIQHPSWRGPMQCNKRTDGAPGYVYQAGWLRWNKSDDATLEVVKMVTVPIAGIVAALVKLAAALGKAHLDITVTDWHDASLAQRRRWLRDAGLLDKIDLGRIDPPLAGTHGILVVTGATPPPEKDRTKKTEAAFLTPSAGTNPAPITMSKAVFRRFRTAEPNEKDDGKTDPRHAWTYWKRYPNQPVPVFFLGTAERAASDPPPAPEEFFFSLNRWTRVPFARSVGDMVARTQPPASGSRVGRLDFVQALFGHVPGEVGEAKTDTEHAWRSRVFFGTATLRTAGAITQQDLVSTTLATLGPKASFYPFYLRPHPPESALGTIDYNHPDARMAGRKRYPARDTTWGHESNNSATDSEVHFLPGDPRSCFEGRIRFTNLLPEELGGLIWAISLGEFGQRESPYRHMLGRAKAHGYGQVRAEITDCRLTRNDRATPGETDAVLSDCMARFERYVLSNLPASLTGDLGFKALRPIRELRALSNPGLGKRLDTDLRWPAQHPKLGSDADSVVTGYMAVRERTYGTNKRPVNDTAAAREYLPPYPTEESDEG